MVILNICPIWPESSQCCQQVIKKNSPVFFLLGPVNAVNSHFQTYVQSGQNPVNAVNGSKKNIVPFFSTWASQRCQRPFSNICPIWSESSQCCQRVKKKIVPFFSTWASQRCQRSFSNICPIWPESSQLCKRVKKKHSPVFFDLGQSTLSTVIFKLMSNFLESSQRCQ